MRRTAALILAVSWLASCGLNDQATQTPPGAALPAQLVTGRALAKEGYGEDPQEIGGQWYEYDSTTHALTPYAAVFALLDPQREPQALWEIESYYDARGESGVFSLRVREREGEGFGAAKALVLTGNVKTDGPQCIAYGPMRQVSCDSPERALIFRTSWRAVPEAGFAVNNPSIFLASHYALGEAQRLSLASINAATVDEIALSPEEIKALPERLSAQAAPQHSRIGRLEGSHLDARYLQVTATMKLVSWRFTALDLERGALSLELRCQPVSYPDAASFDATPAQTKTLELALGQGYAARYIKLCEDEAVEPVEETLDAAQPGLWPDERRFDLFFERDGDTLYLRLAPGNLLWDWSDEASAQGQDLLPASRLWQGLP